MDVWGTNLGAGLKWEQVETGEATGNLLTLGSRMMGSHLSVLAKPFWRPQCV